VNPEVGAKSDQVWDTLGTNKSGTEVNGCVNSLARSLTPVKEGLCRK
jgi:hypothetical protein